MTRTSRLATILSISGAMALTAIANAQAPGLPPGAPGAPGGIRPGGPGGFPGGPGGAQGSGGAGEPVTNAGTFGDSTSFTDTTTTTTTEDSTLPNTGGEPLIMVLGGLTLAASAFAVRRKLA